MPPPNTPPGKVNLRSFFAYPMPVSVLIAAATDSQQFQIEAATDFYWIKSTYMADTAGASTTDSTRLVPNVDVQLQSTGSDKNLFNSPVPVSSAFGTGQIPFILPFPMVLTANSLLRADFTSREAAIAVNLRLLFIGWKDYGYVDAA